MEPGSGDVDTLFARAVELAPLVDETGNEYFEAIRHLHRRPDRAVFECAAGLCVGSTAAEKMVAPMCLHNSEPVLPMNGARLPPRVFLFSMPC